MAEASPRRLWRYLLLLPLLPVIGLLVFLGVNLLPDTPPSPLYTEADLGPEPPPEDNGWTLLDGIDLAPPGGPVAETLNHVLVGRLALDDLGSRRSTWVAAEYGRHLSECAEVFARPRLVDACRPRVESTCPHHVLFQCHSIVLLAGLDELHRGDARRGEERLVAVVERLGDHAQHVRTIFGTYTAQSMLDRTFRALERVHRWRPGAAAPLLAAVGKLPAEAFDPRQALPGEYMWMREAIMRTAELSDMPAFLLDRRATQEVLDQMFRDLEAGGPWAMPPQRDRFGWWFHNPTGKRVLDGAAEGSSAWEGLQRTAEANRNLQARLVALGSAERGPGPAEKNVATPPP